MRKGLLVLSLVGLTVLASAADAQAQSRGYGGWWGGGGYYPQAGYYNSYYGGYYPQVGYYNSYYGNVGYAPYYQGYAGYDSRPAASYSQPAVAGYNSQPAAYNSYYSQPAASYSQPAASYSQPPASYATVTVVVPTADAQVWFENTATKQQGTERVFHSPALEPGNNFTYTIKARWIENGKTVDRDRQVIVQAGKNTTVNFRDSPSEIVPAPDAARPK